MFFVEWKDVILLIVGSLLSIMGGIIGAYVQRRYSNKKDKRPINQLLNFGPDNLLFIFAHRREAAHGLLPRMSIEDFMAINNIIDSLYFRNWSRHIGIRDTSRLIKDDNRRNLVIIGGYKSNEFISDFQTQYIIDKNLNAFIFKTSDNGAPYIVGGDGGEYRSNSFDQSTKYIDKGCSPDELPSLSFDDYAIITKITNPWKEQNKLLWIAGIRGIGTWGAAEFIKKDWEKIYNELPPGNKDCDFSALLRINYNNYDISFRELCRVVPI